MSKRNTSVKILGIDPSLRSTVQNGTIPYGVTAAGSKYPVNLAYVSIFAPNDVMGPTQQPTYPVLGIYQDYRIVLDGDWKNRIKPGDPIQLLRGNIRSEYTVQSLVVETTGDTVVYLSTSRDEVPLLNPFIGTSGYTGPQADTYVALGRKLESPNDIPSLVKSFSVRLFPESDTETFRAELSWDVDPSVSVTRVRWRSVPRTSYSSTLSFSVDTQGDYTGFPDITLSSTTGRSARVIPTMGISAIEVLSGGTGYTSAYVLESGGGGTGASFSVSITGTTIDSISVVSGGTGYFLPSQLTVYGDGSGASVGISVYTLSGIKIIDQGGGYMMGPTVTVSTSLLYGATAAQISSSVSLDSLGKLDYLRVTSGGVGYTGATVSIIGGSLTASATPVIQDGEVVDLVLDYSGYGFSYPATVSISPLGTGGTGAQAVANIDYLSEWVYEDPETENLESVITGLKYNIPYEIEIIASSDPSFRGLVRYTNNTFFQFYKG